MGSDAAATGHEVVRNGRMQVPALPVAQHAIWVSLGATQLLLSENECTALFLLARCNAISGRSRPVTS